MKTSTLKVLLASGFGLLSALSASAQMKVGANPTTIDPSAVFQVDAITGGTKQGFLLPRVALTSTTAFTPLASHVAGMTVYNTATAGDVTPGYYYNDGLKWVKVSGAGAEPWFSTATNTGSVLNTEKIYYKGKAAIGNFNTDPDVMQFFGLTNSSSLLAVQDQAVNTDMLSGGTTNTIVASRLLNPASDVSGNYYRNIHSLMHTSGSANYSGADMIGIASNFEHHGSGNITQGFLGLNADAQNWGSGKITTAVGVNSYAINGSTGSIDDAYGNRSSVIGVNGTITNAYSYAATQGGNNANITNSFGLHIDNLVGQNRWGVYQKGANDNNYFAGKVGVGAGNTNPDLDLFYGLSNNQFSVQRTLTSVAGYTNGSVTAMAINPAAAVTNPAVRGLHSLLHTQGAKDITGGDIYAIAANFVHEGTSTIDSKAAGINMDFNVTGGGRVKNGYGILSNIGADNGTIDNAYGIQVTTKGTNAYGVYISPTTATSLAYGMYQEGSNDNNYFAGKVGIGITNPGGDKLKVKGWIGSVEGGIYSWNQVDIGGSGSFYAQSSRGATYLKNGDGVGAYWIGDLLGGGQSSGMVSNATQDHSAGALGADLSFYTIQNGNGFASKRMTITQDGNVGIGTATPTSKLQVVGLPVYATDAAAGTGGLTAGAFFQDATGIVHVKQ